MLDHCFWSGFWQLVCLVSVYLVLSPTFLVIHFPSVIFPRQTCMLSQLDRSMVAAVGLQPGFVPSDWSRILRVQRMGAGFWPSSY